MEIDIGKSIYIEIHVEKYEYLDFHTGNVHGKLLIPGTP